MEFRQIFDAIPEQFDKWRPRYCKEAFADLAAYAGLGSGKTVLEIGPGTGQATEPVLQTGCQYVGIELGGHLAGFMREKFRHYCNFRLINGDFIIYPFAENTFDLVYSAATIQWIPEEIAFSKVYALLKNGGTLAMMLTSSDEKSENERLYAEIQKAYDLYFHPEINYTQKFTYQNAVSYGFRDLERREYPMRRTLCADDYIAYIGTHCTHITLKDPDRTKFYNAIRRAIENAGGQIMIRDTVVLYLAHKP